MLTGVNMLMNPILNMVVHIVLFGGISYFFYFESSRRSLFRVLESEALCIVIVVLETMGVFLIDFILDAVHIVPQSSLIMQSIETAFSKIILLFLYYAVFSRLWKECMMRSRTQYVLYVIMFLYSVVNILAIAANSEKENPLMLILSVGCTIFANMYLLYFVRFSDERNYYKFQLEMMEQQEKLQYESYETQRGKYSEVMRVLHDVDKHIKVIEDLYRSDLKEDAINYTKQINVMLSPLIPSEYSDNPILNCLLDNKVKLAERQGIKFLVEISLCNIDFMKPVDITTLFGNLIDNAIIGCKECDGDKFIKLCVKEYKDILSIRIENSVKEPVPIRKGKIISNKKFRNGHGIGLLNIQRCVNAYDGSILYKNAIGTLICDIILNRTDV